VPLTGAVRITEPWGATQPLTGAVRQRHP